MRDNLKSHITRPLFSGVILRYDVIIVGAGPAGIFTALELTSHSDLRIAIVERGMDIMHRHCPAWGGFKCFRCKPCAILSGWGGAGAFSDGKLTLSPEVGGWLAQLLGKKRLSALIDYVDKVYLKFGAPTQVYGTDLDKIEELAHKATLAGMKLIPMRLRHMGTEKAREVLKNMWQYLHKRVEVFFGQEVTKVIVRNGEIVGVETNNGNTLEGRYVVLAPGRTGAAWLNRIMRQLGVKTWSNPVDIGIRVEFPAVVFEEFTSALYDVKLVYYSKMFDDPVRTFCVNPHGEVITEFYEDVVTVNGQSYFNKRTENTNMAILVSTHFTEPFHDPIGYGRYIARLANILGDGIIIQRLGDLEKGRRSTYERISRSTTIPTLKGATPGDLSFVLPYRILVDILEMLRALNKLSPGIASDHTLLYGVEVKFYSARVDVNENLMVNGVKGLYAIGDGAGITRGLIQASASGITVAHNILEHEGYEVPELELQ